MIKNTGRDLYDEDDRHRLKMGRLLEAEEREARALVEGSGLESFLKRMIGVDGRQSIFRPRIARASTASGRHPFHFSYQCVGKQHLAKPPGNRRYFEYSGKPQSSDKSITADQVRTSDRKISGARMHRNLIGRRADGSMISRVWSVPKSHHLPANTVPVKSVAGKVSGVPRGATARFATEYLVRNGACETDEFGAEIIVHSEGANLSSFWLEIEDMEVYRNARIQTRIIAELPHEPEVGPAGRRKILEEFSEWFSSRGLPFIGVVHKPDKHSDKRNYHMHFVFHDRPVEQVGRQYSWAEKKPEIFWDRDFVRELKAEFALIVNDVLQRADLHRRYDIRSYADMGIDRVGSLHLGTNASALMRAGTATNEGILNDRIASCNRMADIVSTGERFLDNCGQAFDWMPELEMNRRILPALSDWVVEAIDVIDDALEAEKAAEIFGQAAERMSSIETAIERYISTAVAASSSMIDADRARMVSSALPPYVRARAKEEHAIEEADILFARLDEGLRSSSAKKVADAERRRREAAQQRALADDHYVHHLLDLAAMAELVARLQSKVEKERSTLIGRAQADPELRHITPLLDGRGMAELSSTSSDETAAHSSRSRLMLERVKEYSRIISDPVVPTFLKAHGNQGSKSARLQQAIHTTPRGRGDGDRER